MAWRDLLTIASPIATLLIGLLTLSWSRRLAKNADEKAELRLKTWFRAELAVAKIVDLASEPDPDWETRYRVVNSGTTVANNIECVCRFDPNGLMSHVEGPRDSVRPGEFFVVAINEPPSRWVMRVFRVKATPVFDLTWQSVTGVKMTQPVPVPLEPSQPAISGRNPMHGSLPEPTDGQ